MNNIRVRPLFIIKQKNKKKSSCIAFIKAKAVKKVSKEFVKNFCIKQTRSF